MQECVVSSTKLLCPNGHGIQPAKRDEKGYTLACSCIRGSVLPRREDQAVALEAINRNIDPIKDMARIHCLGRKHLNVAPSSNG
jgi:hypothetical protein